MLPAIRKRIDEANKAVDIEGREEEVRRINIPSSEMAALGDLRKSEHIRRVRERLNSKISEMIEAEARPSVSGIEGDEEDMKRPYGLPHGEACDDIWGLIFEHVDDVDDIAILRDSCQLFREMLEKKYKTLRLIQVALKYAVKFGGMKFLLDFRRVCKKTKGAVDKLLSKDRLHDSFTNVEQFESYIDEYCVPKITTGFKIDRQGQGMSGQEMVTALQRLQIVPDKFPIKLTSVMEICVDDLNNRNGRLADIVNNPALSNLRNTFQKFLELAGRGIRSFHYTSVLDRPDTYNQLRDWVELMPQLEMIFAEINEESINNGNPVDADAELSPFPSCPRLKRYVHSSCGFSAPLVSQIFHANPWISDVFVYYLSGGDREEDFTAVLGTFKTVQLEKFKLVCGNNTLPHPDFLQLRSEWPLKSLSLAIIGHDQEGRETSSRTLFAFVNCFKATLEELEINWKLRDTGGYLDVPKVTRLGWKLWPTFMTLEFMVSLEGLRYIDVDVEDCPEINESYERAQTFFIESKLTHIFRALRRIRARQFAGGKWYEIWVA